MLTCRCLKRLLLSKDTELVEIQGSNKCLTAIREAMRGGELLPLPDPQDEQQCERGSNHSGFAVLFYMHHLLVDPVRVIASFGHATRIALIRFLSVGMTLYFHTRMAHSLSVNTVHP